MKKPILTFAMLFIATGSTVVLSSCDDCKDAVAGKKLADLIVNAFDVAMEQDVSGNPYYQLTHTVLNSTLEIKCPEEVKAANAHQNELTLLYSEDEDFSNPQEVSTKEVEILDLLDAGKKYEMENNIEFGVDGFYALAYQLDDGEDVAERNETNNEGEDEIVPTNGRTKHWNFNRKHIFKVTGTSSKESKHFVRHWRTIIIMK